MVKWTSGKSERTLNQSAANGRKEPTLTNAALCMNWQEAHKGDIFAHVAGVNNMSIRADRRVFSRTITGCQ